jgi:hypothetical protein
MVSGMFSGRSFGDFIPSGELVSRVDDRFRDVRSITSATDGSQKEDGFRTFGEINEIAENYGKWLRLPTLHW